MAWLQQHHPASPSRHRPAQRPRASSKEALPGQLRCEGPVQPAPAGTTRHGGPTMVATGCCRGPAQLQRPGLASPSRRDPVRWPCTSGERVPPRRLSCSGTIRPAPAGAVLRDGSALAASGCCRGGPAMDGNGQSALAGAIRCNGPMPVTRGPLPEKPGYGDTLLPALAGTVQRGGPTPVARGRRSGGPAAGASFSRLQKVPSGVAAPRQRQGGATRAAQLRRHGPAGNSRCCLAWQPSTSGEGLLQGLTGYSGMVCSAPAGAVWHSCPAPAARGHCRGSPATAALSRRPWQASSRAVAWHQQRRGAARVARLQWHHLASLAGAIRCSGPAPAEREHCWGGLAAVAQSSRPRQVLPGTSAPRQQRGSATRGGPATAAQSGQTRQAPYGKAVQCQQGENAARVARQQRHHLAALAGAIWSGSPAPVASRHRWGGPATAAWSVGPWQVPSGTFTPCQWGQEGAARASRGRQHRLAGPGWCCLAHLPCAGSRRAPLGQPRNGGTAWPALAGAIQRIHFAPATRGSCRGGPVMAAWPGQPQQPPSGSFALCL